MQRQGRLAHFAEAVEGPGSSACHAPPNAWNTATRCGVYRATLCGNSTPILRVEPNRSGTLVLSGQAGAHYTIEQKSGLQANVTELVLQGHVDSAELLLNDCWLLIHFLVRFAARFLKFLPVNGIC